MSRMIAKTQNDRCCYTEEEEPFGFVINTKSMSLIVYYMDEIKVNCLTYNSLERISRLGLAESNCSYLK